MSTLEVVQLIIQLCVNQPNDSNSCRAWYVECVECKKDISYCIKSYVKENPCNQYEPHGVAYQNCERKNNNLRGCKKF